jgi:transcriptional regulator GlxA family with amidase domain
MRIVLLGSPNSQLLDLAGPAEVFSEANRVLESRGGGRPHYQVELVTTNRPEEVSSTCGLSLIGHRRFTDVPAGIDTLLVAGAAGLKEGVKDAVLLDWLRRQSQEVRRIGSICWGAFLLAEAGLLDGRRATTHWQDYDELVARYPLVRVERDPIFVRDGHVYTSAGVTAGMDLALALVEEDFGREVALAIARNLVLFVRRPGGQSQFSALLELQAADREPLRDLQAWVAEHLDQDLGVERLAERVHMSPRNFARVFTRQVGWTPARFVERLRVEAARRRLEESTAGLDQVAHECGFGSADSLRRSFLRVLRVAPSDYRGRFHTGA